MSTRASTTVSTALSFTARSSASIVSDACATSPLVNPEDALRVRTSVTADLQYQLAFHAAALEALVRTASAFERERFRDHHFESTRSNERGDLIQGVAVGFDQRLPNPHSAALGLGLDLAVRAVR